LTRTADSGFAHLGCRTQGRRRTRLYELRQVGSAEALFRFTQACLNLHIWGDRALVLMREMLATVRVEEIVVGSVTEAADLLLESSSEGRG
jgi:hypothetical protein